MNRTEIAQGYDAKYRTPNYFGDRLWLYRPFVKALVHKAGLRPGAHLLDAGCGQGFFTALLARHGLNALGVDISSVAIAAAREAYGSSGVKFEVADILELDSRNEFDCVYTRSCSMYNSEAFESCHHITDRLLDHVREEGILIFDYYSRLTSEKQSKDWIYHSLDNVRNHFSRYPGTEVYFSLRMETLIFGKFAFSPGVSRICTCLSQNVGIGGELIALVRKTRQVSDIIQSGRASLKGSSFASDKQ